MSVQYITPLYNTHNINNKSLKQPTHNTTNDFSNALQEQSIKTRNLVAPGKSNITKNLGGSSHKIYNAPVTKKGGTNLAIRKLAEEMEQQLLGVLWNSAFAASGQSYQGGLGEEIFRPELINETVKNLQGETMSDLAQRIYDEALDVHEANNGNKK